MALFNASKRLVPMVSRSLPIIQTASYHEKVRHSTFSCFWSNRLETKTIKTRVGKFIISNIVSTNFDILMCHLFKVQYFLVGTKNVL